MKAIFKKIRLPYHLVGYKEIFYETKIHFFGLLIYHGQVVL